MNPLRQIQNLFLLVLLLGSTSCSYLPEGDPSLEYEENADYILLKSSNPDANKAGIIFYPGGLVDPHAYMSSLKDLVLQDHRTVVIVKVTSNLAIWNAQKASAIINDLAYIKKWIVGGHSLGGSVACMDVFNNPNNFDGLFLLAAYSVNDLAEVDIPVISMTGSEDQILDQTKFNDNKVNLPSELEVTTHAELNMGSTVGATIYYKVDGGNHAQFGNYGAQSGDGTATITAEAQQLLVTNMLRQFLLTNTL